MINWIKRFWGSATQYQPGTGRVLQAAPATTAGVAVTEATAVTIPAFFHAMRLYGDTLGGLDWNVVRHLDRGQEVARTHPIHRLLHDEPNEFQTAINFRSTLVGHAFGWGNGYAYVQRDGNYRPTALLPLLPDRTRVHRENGRLTYVTTVNGGQIDLEPYEVYHLAGFGYDGVQGLPLVQLMRRTLGLTLAEEEYAAAYFGNGCTPGGVVEVQGTLSDTARANLKQSMADNHGGLAKAFRTLFLEEGMKFTPLTVDAEKSQLIQSRQFQLGDLARITGLAPHLLYDLSRSTNNNIEHQGIEAVTYSFKPWAKRLEQEANRKLLYESEKGTLETVLDVTPLMAGDSRTQAEVDRIDVAQGAMTVNERRARRGLNPVEGGDTPMVNTAMMPLLTAIQKAAADLVAAQALANQPPATPSAPASPTPTTTTPPADPTAGNTEPDGEPGPDVTPEVVEDVRSAAILAPVVEDVIARMMRREAKAVRSACAKYRDDDNALNRWLEGYTAETHAHVTEAVTPVTTSLRAMGASAADPATVATRFIERTRADVALYLAAPEAERADNLELMIEGWREDRRHQMAKEIMGVIE